VSEDAVGDRSNIVSPCATSFEKKFGRRSKSTASYKRHLYDLSLQPICSDATTALRMTPPRSLPAPLYTPPRREAYICAAKGMERTAPCLLEICASKKISG
jgi:hypothetical protein